MSNSLDSIALEFGAEEEHSKNIKFKHRVAVFFHLVFRILAVLAYLLCSIFSLGLIASFVLIVVLLSMDFWTVKNITGRLLVGLRWWNQIDDDGKSRWVFEARQGAEKSLVSSAESRVFWLSLVLTEVIWVCFLLRNLFSPTWLVVVLVGVILNGANLYGYIRCKLGAGKSVGSSVREATTGFLSKYMFKTMMASATTSNNSTTQA